MKDLITKQLRRDEGERLSAYQDHLGFWTIGVGRLIDSKRGGGITAEESAMLLSNDIDVRIKALELHIPWFKDLDDARKGVLVNMAFQMGIAGLLGFKNTLEAVRTGKYAQAAKGMRESKWYSQTPNRAERLVKQMETGEWF